MDEPLGGTAFEQFLELYEDAYGQGAALLDRYRRDGNTVAVRLTTGQLDWLRSRRDLVVGGRLLPGGHFPFGLTRMFSDFEHRSDTGQRFEAACFALEDYWRAGLGLPRWDWQTGLPPGWAELAAATPLLRDQKGATA